MRRSEENGADAAPQESAAVSSDPESLLERTVLRFIIATGMTMASSACWVGMLATTLSAYLFGVGGTLGALLNQRAFILVVNLTVPFLVALGARAIFGIPRGVRVTAVAAGIAMGGALGTLGSSHLERHDILTLPLGMAWLGSLVGAFAGGRASTAEEPTE